MNDGLSADPISQSHTTDSDFSLSDKIGEVEEAATELGEVQTDDSDAVATDASSATGATVAKEGDTEPPRSEGHDTFRSRLRWIENLFGR